ncbi:RNA polymerase sigma-70 factor [Sphingobacterium sp. LRF_L2]|uniref:RNA polymerase sigma-70 factor n=1 Tax=Sphingobacterium sp. LRF_L2 TaxID=3369421 RepID=UPI003F5E0A79
MKVTEDVSDERLLFELKSGNRNALGLIYNRYSEKMYRTAYMLIAEKQLCEDIVHEIFVRLWISRNKLIIKSLEGYLTISARNQALSVLRKSYNFADIEEVEEVLVESSSIDKMFDVHEINTIVNRNVKLLPPKCQEIFILSREEQLPHKEIATRLNITVKTVENQITIALRKIRNALQNLT